MHNRFLSAAVVLTALSWPASAQSMEPVEDPRELGFDSAALYALGERLDELAGEGVRPGYAAILTRGEQVAYIAEAGTIDLESGEPFTIDSPVRIASMSKPVTALATMMLVEDGAIALDDPVSDYIPAFADVEVATSLTANEAGEFGTRPPSTQMTVHHLLTHTAGLGYIFDADSDLGRLYLDNSLYAGSGDLAARMEQLAALPLYNDPGVRWRYSYANDVLGRVIEVASGMPFEDFLRSRIFEPLDMPSTGFFFEDVDFTEADMSPLYVHNADGEMVEYDQPNPDWASGGGGLVSTARDYARFATMLANGGRLDGVRLVRRETLEQMTVPQVEPGQLTEQWNGTSYGYGFAIVLAPAEGQQPAGIPGDFGWGGMFDTDFFVSPTTGVAAVIMTQIQPGPHRPQPDTRETVRPLIYRSFSFD